MLTEYLRKYRLRYNLTQKEMGRRLGTSQCYYSLIESGVRKPSFTLIKRLAEEVNQSEEFIRSLL